MGVGASLIMLDVTASEYTAALHCISHTLYLFFFNILFWALEVAEQEAKKYTFFFFFKRKEIYLWNGFMDNVQYCQVCKK